MDHLPHRRKQGRPSVGDSAHRTRQFVTLLSGGASFADAQRDSGIAAARVLRLLDEPDFQAVAQAILQGRLGPTVVIVDAQPHADAA